MLEYMSKKVLIIAIFGVHDYAINMDSFLEDIFCVH